jgi:tetratricopeptide (TPR) repeat protein
MLKRANFLSLLLLIMFSLISSPLPGLAKGQQGASTLINDSLDDPANLTPEENITRLNAKLLANPADAAAWNDLGIVYAQQENFSLAKDAFIKAVQSDPRQGDYHRNLGAAFVKLEMYELAISEFMAYRQLDLMGGIDYWRLIGNAQIKSGQDAEARKTLQDGIDTLSPQLGPEGFVLVLMFDKLELDAGNGEARKKLLQAHAPAVLRFLENAKESDEGYSQARALVQNYSGAIIDDAKILEESGMLDDAAKEYVTAYELTPGRTDLLPRIVSVHIARDELMDAKVAARLARADHPEFAGTWIASGRVYERIDRREDALDCYKKAFAIDDSIDDLRIVIGNLLMRMGRDKEASEFLKEGVAPGSAKPEVVYNYALSQMREKKYHAAIAALKSVVDEKPEMTEAWIALGQSLQASKQYKQAMEPYDMVFRQSGDLKYLVLKGDCARKAKNRKEAIAAYNECLAVDPATVKARYNLSITYMEVKQYENAVESFQQMLELEPDSYRVYFSMGRSYFHLGQFEEALEAYDLAMEAQETANLFISIGEVYDKQGQKKKAEYWYKKASKL